MDEQLLKVIAQYGIAPVLVVVLGRVMWQIGQRMITAIDNLGTKWETAGNKMADRFDAHTKADIETIQGLTRQVEHLDGKFDAVLDSLDRTPVNGVPEYPPTRQQQAEEQQRSEPKLLRSGVTPATGTTVYAHHKQRGKTHG